MSALASLAQIIFNGASGVYGENGYTKRELREHIYIYISEISIESALASLAQ